MNEILQIIIGVLLAFFALIGMMLIIQGNQFFMYQYFAPKATSVQSETTR